MRWTRGRWSGLVRAEGMYGPVRLGGIVNNFSMTMARVVAAGILTAFAACAVAQQAYPNKPIRLITPYPPGGTTSPLARIVGEKLTESWGQQVLVENRGGGNTIIGVEAAARSAPDGYTLLLIVQTHVIVPSLMPTPYDPIKDFTPVGTVSKTELTLVLHPAVPANNLQEFIAYAKSKPGAINYASSGGGTTTHLAAAIFEHRTGVKMQHIPYKGGGPAMTDLLGGQVQAFFQSPLVVMPFVKAGKIKGIAISGEARFPGMPQVPTFSEAGLPGFELGIWYGILAPAGTPKEIVDRLSAELARMLAAPDVREKLENQGMDPFISTPTQFSALMAADYSRFAQVIKAANIKFN